MSAPDERPQTEAGLFPAESAFIRLADLWVSLFERAGDGLPPARLSDLDLASLLLTVEWGGHLSRAARGRMARNLELLKSKDLYGWQDYLLWQLCLDPRGSAVAVLSDNLSHHRSGIRRWLIDIAWTSRSWISAERTVPHLLKNLADTLVGPMQAAGLAAEIVGNEEEFFDRAADFIAPEGYEDQYRTRLNLLKGQGLLEVQAPFWAREAHCRKLIETAAFGR